MPSLLERFAKRWRDAPRDVVLIVVSLLIAFALDAWWDKFNARGEQAEQIATLRAEFVTARSTLAYSAAYLDSSTQATVNLLELMGPRAPAPHPDTVLALLVRSFNFGVSVPSQAALDAVLAAGNPRVLDNPPLRRMLARWSALMDELARDGQHLERNRDMDLQAALVAIGVPGLAVAASTSQLGLPPSAFPPNTERLVRSVGVYAGLYYRALRFRVLSASINDAIETADTILEQLDGSGGG